MKFLFFLLLLKLLGRLPCANGIAGGYKANPDNFKTAGAAVIISTWKIGVEHRKDVEYATGFLITRKHVLTGALVARISIDLLRVFVGTTHYYSPEGQIYFVTQLHRPNIGINDDRVNLCILKLNRRAHYSWQVTLIPLATEWVVKDVDSEVGTSYYILGFGLNDDGPKAGELEPTLSFLEQLRDNDDICHNAYPYLKQAENVRNLQNAYWCIGHSSKQWTLQRPTLFDYGAPLVRNQVAYGINIFFSLPNKMNITDQFPVPFLAFTKHVREQIWKLVGTMK